MTITLEEKIARVAGIFKIYESEPIDSVIEYRYIVSYNYYEYNEAFKNGIDDLMILCGLSFSYRHVSFGNVCKNIVYYDNYVPLGSYSRDKHHSRHVLELV